MKFLRVLLVLAVLVTLGIYLGWVKVEFHTYTAYPPDAAAASSTPSRDVEDVLALRRAAAGGNSSATVAVYRLIERASALGTRPGARLIGRRLPALAATVEREFPVREDRVRRFGVQTPVGWGCREAALRLLVRERRLFRALAADAGTEPTWTAVDHFRARVAALQGWYETELRSSCLPQAAASDRAAVRRAMHQF